MSDTYTIVIVKREHPAEGREWIAACEFGQEAPDSDMAGGAAYGVAPTADEAIAHVLREIGLPTQQVPAQAALPKSIADVATERATHEGRGWTAEHDREHGVDHLIGLANRYALSLRPDRRAALVKAAALLIAAIDLLDAVEKDRPWLT